MLLFQMVRPNTVNRTKSRVTALSLGLPNEKKTVREDSILLVTKGKPKETKPVSGCFLAEKTKPSVNEAQ